MRKQRLSFLFVATLCSCGAMDEAATGSAAPSAVADSAAPIANGDKPARKPDESVPPCAAPSEVPAALAVPAGNYVKAAYFAQGVQIYTCQPAAAPGQGYAWTLKAPDARLTDLGGVTLGKHYAGPTWESNDGSKVVGAVLARANAPEAGAVQWLLLRAAQNSGEGVFANVTYVQRLHTSAGAAPATGCDASTIGAEVRMPYSTLYYYYAAGRGPACRD